MKISFNNDYIDGAHPSILEYLSEINNDSFTGYGYDHISEKAKNCLKEVIGNESVDIEFFAAGTITNLVAIANFLRPHHAIISSNMGHINVHEAGSIEAIGHKIIPVYNDDGKIKVSDIENQLLLHEDEHMVLPKLVYISNTLENGLVYTKQELIELSACCRKHDLYLFLDGARIGSALDFLSGDLTLNDLSTLVDAFYIGGTKNGMLFGEALVISNDDIKSSIRYVMKQKGAIMAKTWVVAAQFYTLFKDGLYFKLASNANTQAKYLYDELQNLGIEFFYPYSSNLVFPILKNSTTEKLFEKYDFLIWERLEDDKCVVRLVCSWATTKDKVVNFITDIKNIL